MASLYKRATPPQQRILRAVEGAVHNACHAHPGIVVSARFARSVAKRAAGTISAQMPGLLAPLTSASEQGRGDTFHRQGSTASHPSKVPDAPSQLGRAEPREAVTGVYRRLLFFSMQIAIGKLARQARKAGQQERLDTLIEVLRLIDEQIKEPAQCTT